MGQGNARNGVEKGRVVYGAERKRMLTVDPQLRSGHGSNSFGVMCIVTYL